VFILPDLAGPWLKGYRDAVNDNWQDLHNMEDVTAKQFVNLDRTLAAGRKLVRWPGELAQDAAHSRDRIRNAEGDAANYRTGVDALHLQTQGEFARQDSVLSAYLAPVVMGRYNPALNVPGVPPGNSSVPLQGGGQVNVNVPGQGQVPPYGQGQARQPWLFWPGWQQPAQMFQNWGYYRGYDPTPPRQPSAVGYGGYQQPVYSDPYGQLMRPPPPRNAQLDGVDYLTGKPSVGSAFLDDPNLLYGY
jgi:ribosome modulation factor